MTDINTQAYDIPKTCKAGVVINDGPDFHVEVQDVDVPEPGTSRKQQTHNLMAVDPVEQDLQMSSSSSMRPVSACPIYTSCSTTGRYPKCQTWVQNAPAMKVKDDTEH
jgi:hypothetical protein